jgi:hypothetical protein
MSSFSIPGDNPCPDPPGPIHEPAGTIPVMLIGGPYCGILYPWPEANIDHALSIRQMARRYIADYRLISPNKAIHLPGTSRTFDPSAQ